MQEHHFAISDLEYNLVTTLSNLLQGEDALHKYTADAEAAGDEKALALFRELHDSNKDFAQRVRECLHDQFMKS